MRKFACMLAALGAMAIVMPSMADAHTVVIKRGHNHHGWHGAHARMHHDHGWHRGWRHHPHHHGDRVVIKKRYYRY